MKWFLSVIALVAAVGIAATSCGPKEKFCPTGNPDPTDLSCHQNLDAQANGGSMGSLCDGGLEYICTGGVHQCTPC